MRHLILISGKDSLAAALVQTARKPDLPYEFLFNDVAAELPETYEWLDRVEQKTGWCITRAGRDLLGVIDGYGGFLPNGKSRYCTRMCKIEPMELLIGNDECVVYYGLRADEARTGYVPLGRPNVTPAYPLRDCGIDLMGVYAILDAKGLVPPDFFWKRLYDAVAAQMDAAHPGWEEKLSRIERQRLFAGRTRANCFMCFFQRQYEFLWLFETHPDLFAKASALEKTDYTFQQGFRLASLLQAEVRDRVFNRRVKEVCKHISGKLQGNLFGESGDNELALTSCGLLCGK